MVGDSVATVAGWHAASTMDTIISRVKIKIKHRLINNSPFRISSRRTISVRERNTHCSFCQDCLGIRPLRTTIIITRAMMISKPAMGCAAGNP